MSAGNRTHPLLSIAAVSTVVGGVSMVLTYPDLTYTAVAFTAALALGAVNLIRQNITNSEERP